ncbi:Crp/Fnr family transcriptional regulator [Halomonas denitrificans]|nr:Crp/Fnr family transcriptional regulator [Halomonas denitrificans]
MSGSWIDRWSGGLSLERDDRRRLESISTRGRSFEAGQVLVFEDDDAPLLFFVERGWAAAVRDLADGSMQILDLFLAGQIIGLREITSPDAISSYRALTDLDVQIIRKCEMQDLIEHCAPIREQVFRAIAREEAWLLERITMLGQRDAAQCLAHLMLELEDRLSASAGGSASAKPSGNGTDDGFDLPLNQEQLGNIVGITPVHVSRTLKQLASDGLLEVDRNRVRILDRTRCEDFSDYDRRRMRLDP